MTNLTRLVSGVVCSVGVLSAVPVAAISYLNPFHSGQCDRAIRYAMARLDGFQPRRAEEILAEGLLCRGLAGDDWALREAIERLNAVVGRAPYAIYPNVYLAEAKRRYASASEEALEATRQARARIEALGASTTHHRSLVRHLRANEVAMRKQRRDLILFLEASESDAVAGRLSSGTLQRVVSGLALLGSEGRDRARWILERHREKAHLEPGLPRMVALLAAGLDCGEASLLETVDRFTRAARMLCGDRTLELEAQVCATARARSAELHRIVGEREAAGAAGERWRKG